MIDIFEIYTYVWYICVCLIYMFDIFVVWLFVVWYICVCLYVRYICGLIICSIYLWFDYMFEIYTDSTQYLLAEKKNTVSNCVENIFSTQLLRRNPYFRRNIWEYRTFPVFLNLVSRHRELFCRRNICMGDNCVES